jgi:hypothetical protein
MGNESRWSVAVSFSLLFKQSSDQTNQLSKKLYLSILKQLKTVTFDQKGHKRSINYEIKYNLSFLVYGVFFIPPGRQPNAEQKKGGRGIKKRGVLNNG